MPPRHWLARLGSGKEVDQRPVRDMSGVRVV